MWSVYDSLLIQCEVCGADSMAGSDPTAAEDCLNIPWQTAVLVYDPYVVGWGQNDFAPSPSPLFYLHLGSSNNSPQLWGFIGLRKLG